MVLIVVYTTFVIGVVLDFCELLDGVLFGFVCVDVLDACLFVFVFVSIVMLWLIVLIC